MYVILDNKKHQTENKTQTQDVYIYEAGIYNSAFNSLIFICLDLIYLK